MDSIKQNGVPTLPRNSSRNVEYVVVPIMLKRNCRYKNYDCNNYGSKGHLSTVCKKGKKDKKNNKTQNKFLSNNDIDDTINYDLSNKFFSIIDQTSQNRVEPFTVNLIVEKRKINFEIDTGSQHSVISEKLYSQYLNHIKLEKMTFLFLITSIII